MSQTDLARFTEACNYPGALDAVAVERNLQNYLDALGVKRKIERLPLGWRLEEHPALSRYADAVLDNFVKRSPNARAARDALDARDARDADAPRRFAAWCIQSGGWWWRWELSWIVTTDLGAREIGNDDVRKWTKPLLEAFIAGAWILYWTKDVLYWVAKPAVHIEVVDGRRRLHHATGAAIASDIEPLYYWHGVMVPAFVIVRPDQITPQHIRQETNAEVRRVMLERYGFDRYMRDIDATVLDSDKDQHGRSRMLRRAEIEGDEPLVMLSLTNSTAESDGSFKPYTLRVPPDMRTCQQAVAWTFDLTPDRYQPAVET